MIGWGGGGQAPMHGKVRTTQSATQPTNLRIPVAIPASPAIGLQATGPHAAAAPAQRLEQQTTWHAHPPCHVRAPPQRPLTCNRASYTCVPPAPHTPTPPHTHTHTPTPSVTHRQYTQCTCTHKATPHPPPPGWGPSLASVCVLTLTHIYIYMHTCMQESRHAHRHTRSLCRSEGQALTLVHLAHADLPAHRRGPKHERRAEACEDGGGDVAAKVGAAGRLRRRPARARTQARARGCVCVCGWLDG